MIALRPVPQAIRGPRASFSGPGGPALIRERGDGYGAAVLVGGPGIHDYVRHQAEKGRPSENVMACELMPGAFGGVKGIADSL